MQYTTNKYAQSGSMNTHNTHSKFIDLLVPATTINHSKIALNNNNRAKDCFGFFGSRTHPAKHPKNQYKESEKSRIENEPNHTEHNENKNINKKKKQFSHFWSKEEEPKITIVTHHKYFSEGSVSQSVTLFLALSLTQYISHSAFVQYNVSACTLYSTACVNMVRW